jgi:hypothetical protein
VTGKNGKGIRRDFQSPDATGDGSSPVPLQENERRRYISGVTGSHCFWWQDRNKEKEKGQG